MCNAVNFLLSLLPVSRSASRFGLTASCSASRAAFVRNINLLYLSSSPFPHSWPAWPGACRPYCSCVKQLFFLCHVFSFFTQSAGRIPPVCKATLLPLPVLPLLPIVSLQATILCVNKFFSCLFFLFLKARRFHLVVRRFRLVVRRFDPVVRRSAGRSSFVWRERKKKLFCLMPHSHSVSQSDLMVKALCR